MLWPPWAVGADTDEPPVPQGPMQPPRSQASAEPGAGGDSGPRRRALGQHMARPEGGARGSRKSSLSSSSSSSTELRANLARKAASQSGQGRCAPSWSMRDASRTAGSETVSPESGGVTWRGGQQLELGARETPAGCRLRCSLYPLCDSGQRFPIASDPFLPTFDCYETLYLWKIWRINTVNPYHFFPSCHASAGFLLPDFIG